ncbi:MAG: hypothetical protein EPN97_00100 [Alphaproteobacteria bacterium]|nr:MAG: hypothetical protein EPN97_00100 [Alphaproteobacteria bacterium]
MNTAPIIAPVYAGLLGLMLVVLSWRIMRMRAKLEVMAGDGGEKNLNVAVRIQGNFIEYVPMALLLILITEAEGYPAAAIHALCLSLIAARLCHVHGMMQKGAAGKGRRFGAMLTFIVIVVASLMSMCTFGGWIRM